MYISARGLHLSWTWWNWHEFKGTNGLANWKHLGTTKLSHRTCNLKGLVYVIMVLRLDRHNIVIKWYMKRGLNLKRNAMRNTGVVAKLVSIYNKCPKFPWNIHLVCHLLRSEVPKTMKVTLVYICIAVIYSSSLQGTASALHFGMGYSQVARFSHDLAFFKIDNHKSFKIDSNHVIWVSFSSALASAVNRLDYLLISLCNNLYHKSPPAHAMCTLWCLWYFA